MVTGEVFHNPSSSRTMACPQIWVPIVAMLGPTGMSAMAVPAQLVCAKATLVMGGVRFKVRESEYWKLSSPSRE